MRTAFEAKALAHAGEFLLCAELGRRGWVAAPFQGHLPHFDLVVVDAEGRSVLVAVHTTSADDGWTLRAGDWLEFRQDPGLDRDTLLGVADPKVPGVVDVFVALGQTSRRDRFYIVPDALVRDLVHSTYLEGLIERNPASPKPRRDAEILLSSVDLDAYLDRWDLVASALQEAGIAKLF